MNTTTRNAILASVLAVCATASTAAQADAGDGASRWEARQRQSMDKVIASTDRARTIWGLEHRPNKSIVLELDPPLPNRGESRVEVELFTPFLEDDGVSTGDLGARDIALGVWWPSIEQAGLPVSLIHRQVDEGPGLDSRYQEYRRAISSLVVQGAWHATQGDVRGLEIVRLAMQRHAESARPSPITAKEVDGILARAGFEPAVSRESTNEVVEKSRTRDHKRWNALATQYLAWDGYSDRTSPLGRISQPVIVIDGRYLVSAMTIARQGGHRGIERMFQTVNRLIRRQIEKRKLATKGEKTMNMTAVALAATVCVGITGCGPTMHAGRQNDEAGQERVVTNSRTGLLPPNGWKREIGPAEILPDAAHVRMTESGTILRVIFLEPLEGAEARQAQQFLQDSIEGKTLKCSWHKKATERGDPRAVTADATPIAGCKIKKHSYSACRSLTCFLNYTAISNGHGRLALGPWQKRTRNAKKRMGQLAEAQAQAQGDGKGLWHPDEG